MRPEHNTHKHATPASGLFNQTVQSKRRLYRTLVSLHPLLFGLWILEPAPKDSEQHNGPKK